MTERNFQLEGREIAQRVRRMTAPADDPDLPELLADYLLRLSEWFEAGERIDTKKATAGVMFALGGWWADRPWRER